MSSTSAVFRQAKAFTAVAFAGALLLSGCGVGPGPEAVAAVRKVQAGGRPDLTKLSCSRLEARMDRRIERELGRLLASDGLSVGAISRIATNDPELLAIAAAANQKKCKFAQ